MRGFLLKKNFIFAKFMRKMLVWVLFMLVVQSSIDPAFAEGTSQQEAVGTVEPSDTFEVELDGYSIFYRAWQGGVIVFGVLLILVFFSIFGWAIVITKWLYLGKLAKQSDFFITSFWESRSLNDLNGRLTEFSYSPVKEVFRIGYTELVKGSNLKESTSSLQIAARAALENLDRSLKKAKVIEVMRMEKYLPFLAMIASSAPFIGLFGTVWGIMGAFEGIARSGSASLAAVAPGISEALIATAFGLGAAIPAAIGYNLSRSKIRHLLSKIDGFSADFLNIVERYMVTDKSKQASAPVNSPI